MATITITITTEVAKDFTELAKERGYETGKEFLIAQAKAELAYWRASKKVTQAETSEMDLLDGQIS